MPMARVVTNPTVPLVAGSTPTNSFNAPMVSNGSVYPTSSIVTVATLSLSTMNGYGIKSLPLIVTITVAMALVSFLAVALNGLAIVAFAMHPNLRGYSDWFICNLAVADFCVGLVGMPLFIPNEVAGYWTFSHGLCLFWLTWDFTTTSTTTFCITIIAIDRYLLVKYPIQYLRWKRRRSLLVLMLAGPWVFCSLLYVPTILIWDAVGVDTHHLEKDECQVPYIDHFSMALFTATVEFIIPITVLVTINTLIFIELRNRRRKRKKSMKFPSIAKKSPIVKYATTENKLSHNCSSSSSGFNILPLDDFQTDVDTVDDVIARSNCQTSDAISLAGSRDPQTAELMKDAIARSSCQTSGAVSLAGSRDPQTDVDLVKNAIARSSCQTSDAVSLAGSRDPQTDVDLVKDAIAGSSCQTSDAISLAGSRDPQTDVDLVKDAIAGSSCQTSDAISLAGSRDPQTDVDLVKDAIAGSGCQTYDAISLAGSRDPQTAELMEDTIARSCCQTSDTVSFAGSRDPQTDVDLAKNAIARSSCQTSDAVSLAGSRDPQTLEVVEGVIVHYNAKASADQHDFIAAEQTKLQTSRLRSHSLDLFPHPDTNRIGESSTSIQLERIKSPAAPNSRKTQTCLSPRDEHIEVIFPDVQSGSEARFEQLVESAADQKGRVGSPTLRTDTSRAPIKMTLPAINNVSHEIHHNRAEQQSITESPSLFLPNTSEAASDAGHPIFRSDLCRAAGMERAHTVTQSGTRSTQNTSQSKKRDTDLGLDKLSTFTTKRRRASDLRNRKAARYLLIMIVVFIACWCPFEIALLYMAITGNKRIEPEGLYSCIRWLLWINSTINPLLYPLLYKRYRIAYIDTLKKMKCWKS
ncbi:uncharacterized protein [Littorina saxatilis]|uniref:G-protein coupled receptors family 1 profile domain-containing protein n=1 Tax=Littorina saxatilis TaxID=31220 RepID=A0AAN9G7M5_9CAEN